MYENANWILWVQNWGTTTAMTWFKALPEGSIDSWKTLCKKFTSHFTSRRKQPKTVSVLSAIVQGKKETLREYIERFTRTAVDVKDSDDKLLCWIFKKGLKPDSMFKEKLGLEAPLNMHDLLTRAQPYINYEEKLMAEVPSKQPEGKKKEGQEKSNEGSSDRRLRIPKPRFSEYTPPEHLHR
jgi:hypothetical protein